MMILAKLSWRTIRKERAYMQWCAVLSKQRDPSSTRGWLGTKMVWLFASKPSTIGLNGIRSLECGTWAQAFIWFDMHMELMCQIIDRTFPCAVSQQLHYSGKIQAFRKNHQLIEGTTRRKLSKTRFERHLSAWPPLGAGKLKVSLMFLNP